MLLVILKSVCLSFLYQEFEQGALLVITRCIDLAIMIAIFVILQKSIENKNKIQLNNDFYWFWVIYGLIQIYAGYIGIEYHLGIVWAF